VLLQGGQPGQERTTSIPAGDQPGEAVYVNFAVPTQSLPEVRKYMAAGPLDGRGAAHPMPSEARRKGSSSSSTTLVDPTTGTIRLRAQFDNADAALWPGQFRQT